LTAHFGAGETYNMGTYALGSRSQDLHVAIRFKDRAVLARILLDPDLGLGEAYVNGDFVIVEGTLWDLMEIIGRNITRRPDTAFITRISRGIAALFARVNNPSLSRRNVAHHYDLSEEFYRLFLDEDMQYSCAYFAHPNMSLEQAQFAKKTHIIKKLALSDGQYVLDIGCGWGGMALSIAKAADVQVTGITLSVEQLRVAQARAEAEGLSKRVKFELMDYRSITRKFDRIVSVGMFEHVGPASFDCYFNAIERMLPSSGVALIHSIGRKDPGTGTNPWIARHIFPGGYIPAASEALAAVERSGLWATDVEILRLHYAETLRHWRGRIERNKNHVIALYDERFYRMWCFYLASCEMAFRYNGLMVFQMQLSSETASLPLTRDYMNDHSYLAAVTSNDASTLGEAEVLSMSARR